MESQKLNLLKKRIDKQAKKAEKAYKFCYKKTNSENMETSYQQGYYNGLLAAKLTVNRTLSDFVEDNSCDASEVDIY